MYYICIIKLGIIDMKNKKKLIARVIGGILLLSSVILLTPIILPVSLGIYSLGMVWNLILSQVFIAIGIAGIKLIKYSKKKEKNHSEKNHKSKFLFLTSKGGRGHISAGEALEYEFKDHIDYGKFNVKNQNDLDQLTKDLNQIKNIKEVSKLSEINKILEGKELLDEKLKLIKEKELDYESYQIMKDTDSKRFMLKLTEYVNSEDDSYLKFYLPLSFTLITSFLFIEVLILLQLGFGAVIPKLATTCIAMGVILCINIVIMFMLNFIQKYRDAGSMGVRSWDNAQKKGNIKKLRKLANSKNQWWFWLFKPNICSNLDKQINRADKGKNFTLIDTQPLFSHWTLEALKKQAKRNADTHYKYIKVLTDFVNPGDDKENTANHFLYSIRKMKLDKLPQNLKVEIRVPATKATENSIKDNILNGKVYNNVKIETEKMPVRKEFEEEYLNKKSNTLKQNNNKVFIMLGSQASVEDTLKIVMQKIIEEKEVEVYVGKKGSELEHKIKELKNEKVKTFNFKNADQMAEAYLEAGEIHIRPGGISTMETLAICKVRKNNPPKIVFSGGSELLYWEQGNKDTFNKMMKKTAENHSSDPHEKTPSGLLMKAHWQSNPTNSEPSNEYDTREPGPN